MVFTPTDVGQTETILRSDQKRGQGVTVNTTPEGTLCPTFESLRTVVGRVSEDYVPGE